jgi:hypothetical protein
LGVGDIASPFLTSEIDGMSGQLREAEWPPEPVYTSWRIKNILPLPGMKLQFLDRPALSLVAIPNELSQRLYGKYVVIWKRMEW